MRKADQKAYLDWAVDAFRLATSGVSDATQIHTHLCYSEFGEVITAVDALQRAVAAVPAERLWVNPDCGLKTRGYAEVEASLRHLVAGAAEVRGH